MLAVGEKWKIISRVTSKDKKKTTLPTLREEIAQLLCHWKLSESSKGALSYNNKYLPDAGHTNVYVKEFISIRSG